MTHKYHVMNQLDQVCTYEFKNEEPRLTRENPAHIRLGTDIADFAGFRWVLRTLQTTAWIYERVTTAEVLRIDMKVPFVEATNFELLKKKIDHDYRRMPYGRASVHQDGTDTAEIGVTHSLHAADVSAEGLREVLLGMVWGIEQVLDVADAIEDLARQDRNNLDGEDEDDDGGEDDKEKLTDSTGTSPDEDPSDDNGDESENNLDDVPDKLRCPDHVVRPADLDADQDPLGELESLIGLGDVKQLVSQLAAQQRVAQRRREAGFQPVALSPHLVFTGNPGTGKTTVARLIGKLYKQLGLLKSGHLIEADRSTLVAPYVGQTALKTLDVCRRALDGILFIDEAYTLAGGHQIDFGHEVIATLLTFMENNRGRFALVVAGYDGKMQTFLGANPGLRSRFDVTISFPDFSENELIDIFDGLVSEFDYQITPKARLAVRDLIAALPRGEGFGNAREIRKVFNNVVANHAGMLGTSALDDVVRLNLITESAIPTIETPASSGVPLRRRSLAGYL